MNEKYLEIIQDLAKKAQKKNEIPVGCVIIYRGNIIAKAYNQRESSNNILGHAEIIAITKAAKKLNTWKLDECEMYVTLEPCEMCRTIIKQSRINKVYYLAERLSIKKEYNKTKFARVGNNEKYLKILAEFFENMRKK